VVSGRVLGLPGKRDQVGFLVNRSEVFWEAGWRGKQFFAAAGRRLPGSTENDVMGSVKVDVEGAVRCRAFRILMFVLPDRVSREERGRWMSSRR